MLDVILGERHLSPDERQAILDTKNQIYIRLLNSIGPNNLLPGVMQLILELRQKGYHIGVASASQHVDRILDRLQIKSSVQAVCDGKLVRHSKPAPDPYLYVADQLGVSPRCCLAVEDSPAGILSAIAAGMWVIGLGAAAKETNPNAYFDDLKGVRASQLQEVYDHWREWIRAAYLTHPRIIKQFCTMFVIINIDKPYTFC